MIWAIRNILYSGLLEKLVARFDVFIVLRKPAPEIEEVCRRMGAQVWVTPSVRAAGIWGAVHLRIVNWLNQAHKLRHNLQSEEMKKSVTRRNFSRMQKFHLAVRDRILSLAGKSLLYNLMVQMERYFYYRSHDLTGVMTFLKSTQIDLFLFSAPFQQDSNEVHLMRACRLADVRMIAMVLGFDNLTTKGRLPEFADYYFVWNEIMKSEVPRIYPNVSPCQIFVTGSSQFDFYASAQWGYSYPEFCQRIGLETEKPLVLYAANAEFLIPCEELLVQDLIDRVHNSPDLPAMQFLIRLHPFDTNLSRWQAVQAMKNVVVMFPWQAETGGSWGTIREEDLHILVSSLKYSFCNINISSTMALDSVFCDRPVIGPAYALGSGQSLSSYVRELYDREHFVPITYSGAMTLATSPEELISAIRAALARPGAQHRERLKLTSTMLGKPLGQSAQEICSILVELSRK
jgi:hypothetical protein